MAKKKNEYNIKKFYELLDIARGERSLRKYALDAGVSPAHLYRIRKEEYLPTAKMIQALTSEDAAPRGDITTEDLMIAIGYQNDDSKFQRIAAYQDAFDRLDREERKEFRDRMLAYSASVEGLILKELLARDIGIKTFDIERAIGNSTFRPDIALSINNQKIKEWFFEIKYFSDDDMGLFVHMAKSFLAEMVLAKPQKDRKISLVVNRKRMYDRLVQLKDSISYQGEFSVILVDEKSLSIVEETYLSHFNYNDKSLELKLK